MMCSAFENSATPHINIIKDISKCCDCSVNTGGNISKDIGILLSGSALAIDKASIDLVKKTNDGVDVFKKENHKDPVSQLKYASKYLKQELEYELVEIK